MFALSWGGGGGAYFIFMSCILLVYCALERFSILLYPLIFPSLGVFRLALSLFEECQEVRGRGLTLEWN